MLTCAKCWGQRTRERCSLGIRYKPWFLPNFPGIFVALTEPLRLIASSSFTEIEGNRHDSIDFRVEALFPMLSRNITLADQAGSVIIFHSYRSVIDSYIVTAETMVLSSGHKNSIEASRVKRRKWHFIWEYSCGWCSTICY